MVWMTSVTVRPAARFDLPACATIVNDHIDSLDWLPRTFPREQTLSLFQRGYETGRDIHVAERDDVIEGYISVETRLGLPDHVHGFYLRPDARGKGIGKALLDRAKERSPEGLELTAFEPNVDGQRFYAREGFVEVLEKRATHTEEGVATLFFVWRNNA